MSDDTNIEESISRIQESLIDQFSKCETFDQKKNFLLSLEIISFIHNTLQFMTDIIYLLYYLSYYDVSTDARNLFGYTTDARTLEEQLAAVRVQLCELIIELKISCHDLMSEKGCELFNGNSAHKYRNIVDKNLVRLLTTINEIIFTEMKSVGSELAILLHNCMLGFVNLYDFLKKIPLQTQYKLTKPQVGILLRALGKELIPSWKCQIDKLNVAIFVRLARTEPVVEKYRESTGSESVDVTQGDTFLPYVIWLKDEILRDLNLPE